MPTNILYTAIPDPTYRGPGLRLTVAISPRLIAATATAELAAFPELLDWPARVEGMELDVDLGGVIVPAQVAPPRRASEARDLALWQRLFPASCLVRSWQLADLRGSTVKEFPATAIDARLRAVYAAAAAGGPGLPRVLDVGDLDDCDDDPADPHTLPCELPGYRPTAIDTLLLDVEGATAALRDPSRLPGLAGDARALHDALAFYRRATDADVDAVVGEPTLDLHQRVALCGDHPTLLRRLGLVFDVVLVTAAAPAEPPAQGLLRLRPRWRGVANPEDLRPRTAYDTAGGFRAIDTGGLVADGYLALDRPGWSIAQLDGDGGVLQVASTMAAVRSMLTDPHGPPQHEQALPALRSGGLTLVHEGRALWLGGRFQRQVDLDADLGAAALTSDDLARGLRLDIEVGGGWRSLHRRCGDILDRDDPDGASPLVTIAPTADEEGYVKLASATAPTFAPDRLYLHEAVAGWSGWSLSASRPGRTIAFVPAVVEDDGTVLSPAREEIVDNRNRPGATTPITTRYRATPATLPRLRFGESYRLRARVVDHAAGGLPSDDDDDAHALGPIVYRRFEPVPPPLVVPRAPMREAESLEHVVVRSDPAGARPYDTASCARHLLAPKTSLDLWERHGMIDAALGDPDDLYRIVQRERGTLLEPFIDTRAGRVAVTDRVLCNPASKPEQPTSWPTTRGAPLAEGQYVIATGDRMRLPWLPDPQAAGVVVWDPRDPTGSAVIRRFTSRTDADPAEAAIELESLLVVLHAAAAGSAPRIRPAAETDRELHVDLPPGDRLELRYASLPRDLDVMGLWGLLTASDRAALVDSVARGQHWMFTPARTLTLVHAAQRPVVAPSFARPIVIDRAPGEGRAMLTTSIAAHGHSTSHVDLRARWLEVRDDGDAGPTAEVAEADVARLAFAYDDTEVGTVTTVELVERRPIATTYQQLLRIRRRQEVRVTYHDLPDTRRRLVTYTPIGTTRWQEYFPSSVQVDPTTPTVSNLQTAGEASPIVSIPASAAPAAPVVAQVLPTFQRSGGGTARVRRGNGLRIYLERPWFSSGAGERLAILVERAATTPPQPTPVDWAERVSWWAADAVWSRPAPRPQPLSPASFVIDPQEVVPGFGGLGARPRVEVVPEINGAPVDAIVVVPEFSADRQQWYCDLELTSTGYFPFLSLSLARYQDHSVHQRGLSPVVRAELVQLAPDRSASITVSADGRKVDVRVRGIAAGNWFVAQAAGNDGGAHRVHARVEVPGASGTELDWHVRDELDLTARAVSPDEVEWSGRLAVRAGRPWRVVIEEHELYAGDDHGSGSPPGERTTYVEILTPT